MSLFKRRSILKGLAASASGIGVPGVFAADDVRWPTKPVRVMCSLPAGGLTDAFARAYSDQLSKATGQSFIVENKTGAGSIIACEELKRAAPDGHTVLFTVSTALMQNVVMYKNLPYDPQKDFTTLALLNAGRSPFHVAAAVPAKNMKEFMAWAKTRPVNFGTYAPGSFAHLIGHELNRKYGLSMQIVHYRGEAPMWQDMLNGSLHASIGSYSAAAPFYQSGQARAIAVATDKRVARLPDVATYVEQGFKEPIFQFGSWHFMLAPAGLNPAVRDRISTLMVEAGKGERITKLIDGFAIDEAAADWRTADRVLQAEGPLQMAMVKEMGVTAE